MSEKYKVVNNQLPNFITLTVVDWVDMFVRPIYFKILNESLNYCVKEKGLNIHAYVYMSSHIHLIVSAKSANISDIIRDFKKFTSKEIIKTIIEYPESRREWLLGKFAFAAKRIKRGSDYKVWKDGFHPVLIDNAHKLDQCIHYIHYNPVAAGFVFKEQDWVNSSYRAFMDGNQEDIHVNISIIRN